MIIINGKYIPLISVYINGKYYSLFCVYINRKYYKKYKLIYIFCNIFYLYKRKIANNISHLYKRKLAEYISHLLLSRRSPPNASAEPRKRRILGDFQFLKTFSRNYIFIQNFIILISAFYFIFSLFLSLYF